MSEGRRGEERVARVGWILDEALTIVVDGGLGALTTPRLARAIGYTPAALYRYFESKEDLLAALEAHTAEVLYRRFFESLARARAALVERARRRTPVVTALAEVVLLARVYGGIARDLPRHFELASLRITRSRGWAAGARGARIRDQVMPHVLEIIGTFQRAEDLGALEPGAAPRRAMTAWLAVHAILAATPLAEAQPQLVDPAALRRELVETLLAGWGGDRRAIRAAFELVDATIPAS